MNRQIIKKIAKSITCTVLAFSMIAASSTYITAHADTLSDLKTKYSQLQKQQQDLQTKLNGLKGQVSDANDKKETISKNVDALNGQISNLNDQISTLNSQIDQTNKDIEKTEEDIKNNQKIYEERVCALYEAGNASKVEILLSSKNVTDFFTKVETLKVISDHDTKLINDLKSEGKKLNEQKKSLDVKKTSLDQSKGTLDAKKEVVAKQLAEQKEVVSNLNNSAAQVDAAKKEVKAQAAKTDSQIQAEVDRIAEARRQELLKQNHGAITVAGDGNAIIGYAKGFIGTPYRLGANDPPHAIDCSAFVMDVFAHFGISLNRCSSDQVSNGTPVAKSAMKPCDLVFFTTEGSGVSHVGIYVGGGQFIAANSGRHESGVGIWDLNSAYWKNKFVCARRVIN